MQQWTESDIEWYLKQLASDKIHELSNTLIVVADIYGHPPQPMPTGNQTIINRLEELIDDRRLWRDLRGSFVTWYLVGEIRWLVARLLACEYAFQGLKKPIVLNNVLEPISTLDIIEISKNHQNLNTDDLFQRGLLPTKTEVIFPQRYYDCCSQEAVEERVRKRQELRNKGR